MQSGHKDSGVNSHNTPISSVPRPPQRYATVQWNVPFLCSNRKSISQFLETGIRIPGQASVMLSLRTTRYRRSAGRRDVKRYLVISRVCRYNSTHSQFNLFLATLVDGRWCCQTKWHRYAFAAHFYSIGWGKNGVARGSREACQRRRRTLAWSPAEQVIARDLELCTWRETHTFCNLPWGGVEARSLLAYT